MLLDGTPIEILGEFSSIGAARRAGIPFDAMMIAGNDHADEQIPAEALTTREIQVLELMAEGLSNKGIASALGVSDQTVKFHVASISGKLGASNRTDAVRLAVRRGLITL